MSHQHKRSRQAVDGLLEDIKVVLLDIEGTTTPISFVKDVLFPYIRENIEDYLKEHWDEEECQADVNELRKQAEADSEADMEGVVTIEENKNTDDAEEVKAVRDSVVKNVLWQMDADRKITALKQLQGHMWTTAYKSGDIKGEVYDDVVPAIKHIIADDRQVYIYSSGSVQAQKLLFGYSTQGDLLEIFSGHFDTKIGLKVEKASYLNICEEIGCKPEEVLFLTDVTREARPASLAGMKTCIVVRPGNEKLTEEEESEFNTIHSFSELISTDAQNKKKK
ncbi:enolase-phosphatase E1-like [Ptychodera flava]|uniref:enolase-phosphatase E1-like n=1 Tax=Ptychodera flava TaxID=63121 RepID=UPI00396A5DD5